MTSQSPGSEDTSGTPSIERKRMKPWKLALLVIGAISAGPTILFGLNAYCSQQGYENLPQQVGVNPSGTLYIAGAIDGNLSRMVHETIAGARVPIERIRLNSIGGVADDAEKIGRELKGLPGVLFTEVPDRATCQSACINLLVDVPGELRVAPTATLMFHAGAKRVGLANCGICGLLNKGMVLFSSATQTAAKARALLPATHKLSGNIIALFSMCAINPLDSQNGMTLYGLEFNGLRNGTIKPDELTKWCPSS